MPGGDARGILDEQLGRWVGAGLIEADQAERIKAAEAQREAAEAQRPPGAAAGPAAERGRAGHPGRRIPLVVEALGYVGGVLAIVAGFLAVGELWRNIPTVAELAFAAVAAAALGVGGAFLRTQSDPAFARLRSALWLMSTAALVAFAGLLGGQVWQLPGHDTVVIASAAATVYAVVLWLPGRALLQHLVMFAAAAVFTGTGIAWLGLGMSDWGPGLGVWALSAAWGAAVFGRLLAPQGAGYVAAGAGLLIGAQMTMDLAWGHALAVITVAALLGAGVLAHRVELLVIGAIGVLEVVPQTASRYLPSSVGAPLAIFLVGLILLALALWLAKGRRQPGTR